LLPLSFLSFFVDSLSNSKEPSCSFLFDESLAATAIAPLVADTSLLPELLLDLKLTLTKMLSPEVKTSFEGAGDFSFLFFRFSTAVMDSLFFFDSFLFFSFFLCRSESSLVLGTITVNFLAVLDIAADFFSITGILLCRSRDHDREKEWE